MVLSVINQYPVAGFPGMVVGVDDGRDVETGINNATAVAGVYDLVFNAVNTTLYEATIYGVYVSFTSDGSATAAEIRDGMEAAIEAQPALVDRVTAVDSGSNLRITELDPELYGPANITDLDANTTLTTVTAHSEPETLEAGILVARGTAFQDIRNMSTVSDRLAGITIHQHFPSSAYTTAGRGGYPPNSEVSVLTRGKIWMVTEEAVALTDTPHFRYIKTSANPVLGRVRNDTDSTTCRSGATFARFATAQATPGGLVLVKFNLVP